MVSIKHRTKAHTFTIQLVEQSQHHNFVVRTAVTLQPLRLRGWTDRGSNPGKSKRFFSSRKCSGRLWGPSTLV